jgi:uncharacterized protein
MIETPAVGPPQDIQAADASTMLALNAAHETELSPMTAAQFIQAPADAYYARHVGLVGFLLAYDQNATLDSVNFRWFKARYERFVYVDRLVTAPEARRRGVAAALYQDLARRALGDQHSRLTCEVNRVPPNPASMALHTRLGFFEVGAARTSPDRMVTYLVRDIAL